MGAGLAGASAAWHLASRGVEVTVLERTTPAGEAGSSPGSARIFRYAYADQLYTDLAVRARMGWERLEAESGRSLLSLCGCVDSGDFRPADALGPILERAGVVHEVLSAAAARERWPQFTFDGPVLWQPGAGVLDPRGAVEAMLELARGPGRAEVCTGWEAVRLERSGDGWRVWSAAGESVEASQVVVAAGGWLPALLDGFGLPAALAGGVPELEVRQEQIFHFPFREPGDRGVGWPAYIRADSARLVYGLLGGRDAEFGGYKVAEFNGGRVLGSARDRDGVVDDAHRQAMADWVRHQIPGLRTEPFAEATCLFTNTPTEDFVVDARDGVTLISACSGHGAKFAPLMGEWVADLVLGTGVVPDAFRLR